MIKPIKNKVVIKPKLRKETASGIILPEDKIPPSEGVVVETSSKLIKKGDEVIFSPYGPVNVKIGEETFVVAEEGHILAIIC